MSRQMTVQATLGTGASFDVETGSGHRITLDIDEQKGGQNLGPSPMEMLLVGLAGCAGMSVMTILRRRRQDIRSYEIRIHGERAVEHPQVFERITIEHIFTAHALPSDAVQRAIDLTEQRYCGASAMLDKAATLTYTFRIIEAEDMP
jgi:putative redox protein